MDLGTNLSLIYLVGWWKKRNHSPDMHFDKESKRNARATEIQLMHGQDGLSSFNMAKPTKRHHFIFAYWRKRGWISFHTPRRVLLKMEGPSLSWVRIWCDPELTSKKSIWLSEQLMDLVNSILIRLIQHGWSDSCSPRVEARGEREGGF